MFGFNLDKRAMYIVMAVLLVMAFSRFLSSPGKLLDIVLAAPAVLIAITFHEYAHAFAADKLGDDTPRRQGRLTLNPIAHLDPIGSVLLLVAGFGWGKPVEINPRNFNRKHTMSAGEAIVSVAGPLMNFILAIVFSIVLAITMKSLNIGTDQLYRIIMLTPTSITDIIITILVSFVTINIGLGLFNLIPLPPLDGSKILKNFLPYNAKNWYESNEQLLYMIFLVIWIIPTTSSYISDGIGVVASEYIYLILKLFGIS